MNNLIHLSLSSPLATLRVTRMYNLWQTTKFKGRHKASAKQFCPELPPALALNSGLGRLPGHNSSQRTGSRRQF